MTDPQATRTTTETDAATRLSWLYILRKTGLEFIWDQCTDLAAVLTYHALLAILPALLAIVGLLGVVGQAKTTTTALLGVIQSVAPASAVTLLKQPIEELVRSPSAGIALVVGVLAAVWSASGYVRAFSRAMNRIYGIQEGRPFWVLLPVLLLLTLASLVVIALMAALLVVSGSVAEEVGNWVGLGSTAVVVWEIIRWPLLVALAVVLLAALYYVTPNLTPPRFRLTSVGALIALGTMAAASLGFAFYAANFSHYNKTYGTIGGAIVLLLWIWILNLAVLFGAEFDAEAERGRELRAGIPAERTLQLPLRDERASRKRLGQQDAAVRAGAALRERASRQR